MHYVNTVLCAAMVVLPPPLPPNLCVPQMEIIALPTSLAVGIAKDVADGGVIASRAMAAMDVNVMGG